MGATDERFQHLELCGFGGLLSAVCFEFLSFGGTIDYAYKEGSQIRLERHL